MYFNILIINDKNKVHFLIRNVFYLEMGDGFIELNRYDESVEILLQLLFLWLQFLY